MVAFSPLAAASADAAGPLNVNRRENKAVGHGRIGGRVFLWRCKPSGRWVYPLAKGGFGVGRGQRRDAFPCLSDQCGARGGQGRRPPATRLKAIFNDKLLPVA